MLCIHHSNSIHRIYCCFFFDCYQLYPIILYWLFFFFIFVLDLFLARSTAKYRVKKKKKKFLLLVPSVMMIRNKCWSELLLKIFLSHFRFPFLSIFTSLFAVIVYFFWLLSFFFLLLLPTLLQSNQNGANLWRFQPDD